MTSRHPFRQMDDRYVHEVSGWRYEPPYDFHNGDVDEGGDLVGSFQFENTDETEFLSMGRGA